MAKHCVSISDANTVSMAWTINWHDCAALQKRLFWQSVVSWLCFRRRDSVASKAWQETTFFLCAVKPRRLRGLLRAHCLLGLYCYAFSHKDTVSIDTSCVALCTLCLLAFESVGCDVDLRCCAMYVAWRVVLRLRETARCVRVLRRVTSTLLCVLL